MSYDVAVWQGQRPATDAEALDLFEELADAAEVQEAPPTPAIRSLMEALVLRWPEEQDDGPWSSEPLIDDAVGAFAYVSMTFSSVEEVLPFLVHEAETRGLVCFDPQVERLLPDSEGEPEEADDHGPRVELPVGAQLLVHRNHVAGLLQMSPRQVATCLPRHRIHGDDLDFAHLLTLTMLAGANEVPDARWPDVAEVVRAWWATVPELTVPTALLVDEESAQLATPENYLAASKGVRTTFDLSDWARMLLEELVSRRVLSLHLQDRGSPR